MFFAPNEANAPSDEIVTYPIFDLQKMLAENLGKVRIESNEQNFPSSTVTLCSGDNFSFEELGHVATWDNDLNSPNYGTVYSLILNRSFNPVTIEYNIGGQYLAELGVIRAESLAGNHIVEDFSPVTDLQNLTIPALSICILRLTPGGICHDYTITTSTTWPDGSYPGPYGKVEVKNGATLTINSEARFCTDGELIISDGGKVVLNGTLTADDVYWKGVSMTGSDENTSFISTPNSIIEKSGGIRSSVGKINCTGTTIRNNRIGVSLFGLYHTINARFINCDFRNTDEFSYPNSEFHGFAVLGFMNSETEFLGCSFVEERQNFAENDAGVGIAATLAKFKVDESSKQKSRFENLIWGVYNSAFSVFEITNGFAVKNSVFDRCWVGIDGLFPNDVSIRNNEFILSDPDRDIPGLWQSTWQYGVNFRGTALDFDIEANKFSFDCTACPGGCSGCTNWNKVGTQMSNIGEAHNEIRLNDYTRVPMANIAYGKNGDPQTGTGLLYECNKMHSNPTDFLTGLDPVIKRDQGKELSQGQFEGADNIFDYNPWTMDFSHEAGGQQPSIKYYWKASMPDNVTSNVFVKLADKQNECLPRQKPPGKKLTDGEKKDLLEQYEVLANQYGEAKQAFEDAKNGSDANLIEEKRRHLAYVSRLKWEKVLYGMRAAAFEGNRTEARNWLRRFGTYGADILLAQDYAATQEWAAANNLLDMLSQKYELTETEYSEVESIRSVFNILANKELNQLDVPSREDLDEIAREGSGIPSIMAQSILSFYGKFYPPLYEEVPSFETGGMEAEEGGETSGPRMKVSPNPVSYNVRFDWSEFVVNNNQEVRIEISDKMGGLITVLHPAEGMSELEWTTESISSGIIYYRLIIGGQERDSGQIFVNK